ncbi:metal-dependent hydrolase [Marinomonas piezotolerans]|uniref:Metal-dependent hydrolase n=1 Tax=Marinomonas piezotolerans TaxID=2213058 RepID=A0A370U5F4_9GAMM|nr:HDOD domain-containing protein [Marinomonas piezotolerans]RDL43001.1 metal-dependent hydrolase [Marinomonas piezotolerans]
MKNKSPSGLTEWLLYLQDRKLPASSDNIAKLKKQIKSPDETLDRMQNNIASEPMLAFSILNQANKIVEYKRNDIKSPIHAASMIGMKGISGVFDSLEAYTFSRKNLAHTAFWREVQISYEAAAMARQWAIEKKISHVEDIYWITFFRDAVRWLLWYHAHDVMQELMRRIRKGGESASACEIALLGCRIDELSTELFKVWKVPQVIIDSFLTDHIPTAEELQSIARLTHTPEQLPGFAEDKRITIIMNGPLILAYCASRIAQEANIMGWGSKNLPFFYRVIAAIIHIKLGDAIQLTHFSVTMAAREFSIDAKPSLASQLLSPLLYTHSSKSQKSAPTIVRTKLSPLDRLEQKLKGITDSKQRTTIAMKALLSLFKGSSDQVLILRYDRSQNKLSPMLQFGYDVPLLKQVKWGIDNPVMSKLISKRVAVHFNDTKLNSMLKQMPENAGRLFTNEQHLFLASSPVSDNETYIYWLAGKVALSQDQFDTFKRVIKLAD